MNKRKGKNNKYTMYECVYNIETSLQAYKLYSYDVFNT